MNIKQVIKSLLRDSNEGSYTQVGTQWLSHHDLCHLEVAALPPLPMGEAIVTGIAGVCIPEFGTEHCTPMYDGYLDECRVAIHQALKYPSPCSWVRLVYWCLWMASNGINPIISITQHRGMINGCNQGS